MTRSRLGWVVGLLALAIVGLSTNSASAQEYSRYLHWPYVPPQVPGTGEDYQPLYDGFYRYPRGMRLVPQVQGPQFLNWYGGQRFLGHFRKQFIPFGFNHPGYPNKFYQGYHFILDVF